MMHKDVTQYKIGFWYFDKRQSELKYRLLEYVQLFLMFTKMNNDGKIYIELFWVFFLYQERFCMKLKL